MKMNEKEQENFVRGMLMFTGIAIVVFVLSLLVSSALTILAVNSLMASEVIPLTYSSVFALAWMKFVVLWFFNRISIKRVQT